MNTTIRVKVTANSGAWGIATLNHYIKYEGDPVKFQKDIMIRTLVSGYQAILHYENDLNLAMCIYNEEKFKPLFERILETISEMQWDELALEFRKNCQKKPEWVNYYVSRYNDKYELLTGKKDVISFNQYTNEWMVGCNPSTEALREAINNGRNYLAGIRAAFEAFGLDPEDKESTRRICENLGMYRVAM